MPDYLRQNIRFAANKAWHELLTKGDTYVIKKVEPRDTFAQLRYKLKKIFKDERAPDNMLKFVQKTDPTKQWYQSPSKHKKVSVRIEAFVFPITAEAYPKDIEPNIFAECEETPSSQKPVGLAKLSICVPPMPFYDDKAPTDCRIFTQQVREKFGQFPEPPIFPAGGRRKFWNRTG